MLRFLFRSECVHFVHRFWIRQASDNQKRFDDKKSTQTVIDRVRVYYLVSVIQKRISIGLSVLLATVRVIVLSSLLLNRN